MNSSARRLVLALAVGVLCAIAIGACGDDSSTKASDAQALTEQAFKATKSSLRNGRLDARLQLEPKGLLAIGGPIKLEAKGPFARPPQGNGLPLADLAAVVTVAGQRYDGGLVSDGRRAFLKLDGRAYRLGGTRSRGRLESLRRDLLALEPMRWIKAEQTKADAQIGATETNHVTGTVDAGRLLADLDGLVPAQMGKQIAAAVKSAEFELWAGAEDRIVRQLVLRVAFEFDKGTEPPIAGLEAGTIQLRIRLDDVNAAPPEVRAPARALPLSKVPKDRGLGGLLECLSRNADDGAQLASCVAALDP